jgi:hypothetical protein
MLRYMLPPLVIGILAFIACYHLQPRAEGNIPVRMRRPGKKQWSRGHAVWVHDVFAFRASPARWYESLSWVADIHQRAPTSEERRRLHRLGEDIAVGTLRLNDGGSVDVAARREHGPALFGESQSHAASRDMVRHNPAVGHQAGQGGAPPRPAGIPPRSAK